MSRKQDPGMRAYGAAWRRLRIKARALYGSTCHLCELPIPDDEWTLDHLDPVADHGVAVPSIDRVRPAHKGCNSRKGKGTAARPASRIW
jgi:5-methylcytosine-specific restriction endonuclease McrA